MTLADPARLVSYDPAWPVLFAKLGGQTKRYFREQPGQRRTHIHVRRSGSFSEQFALLFRDYLRTHPRRAAEYGALKRSLAHLLQADRRAYVEAKGPFVWDTIRLADDWAQQTGWEAGRSDA